MDELRLGDPPPKLSKFKVVGYIASPAFQRCRHYVTKLHDYFPKVYSAPEIRAMFDVDWQYFITKMRRRHGKRYYLLRKRVAVYLDDELLGDDADFLDDMSKKYYIDIDIDFDEVCTKELLDYFGNVVDVKRRQLVYLTVAVGGRVLGTMLFLLYNDLVPIVCENFFARCKSTKFGETYRGTPVQRIAKNGWIQCGGSRLRHVRMPCENYVVPHDRKGVLSMCNQFRHLDNSTQFFVTLDAAPWLDRNYVAFGQLLHGVDVLDAVSRVPTYYEAPRELVEIVACGEYSLYASGDDDELAAIADAKAMDADLDDPILDPNVSPELLAQFMGTLQDTGDINFYDTRTIMDVRKFQAGRYCLRTDLKSYFPFMHLPGQWIDYFYGQKVADDQEDDGEGGNDDKDGQRINELPDMPIPSALIHDFTIDDHFFV